jgi:ABC-2 type transport system permease protein
MIAVIARKELTEMIRDGRFRWSAAITMALLLGALALGWQHHAEIKRQHETASKATREQWLKQGKKNPHSAAHYGVYAFKPSMPLSLVDRGVDPYTGVASWLEAHKQNEFRFKPAQDAAAIQRLGEMTGAAVLQLLIPLLIVLLTFSAFSAEREQGTLRLLMSLGVKPRQLAWGKALGIAAALALLLVPAAALGAAALALSSDNGAFAASWPRAALMAAGYLAYFAIFAALSLSVSALAGSSRTALTALLGVWIFNGLIVPKAASDLARSIHPAPSAMEFAKSIERSLEKGIDGHGSPDARVEELKRKLLKQYNVDSIEKLPVNFNGIRMHEGERHGNEVFDWHYSALWDTFDRQRKVHELSSIAAPIMAVRSFSMALAGTDFAQHAHFARAAERYRRDLNERMNMDIAVNQKPDDANYMRGEELWAAMPEFVYTAPDLEWVLSRQKLSIAMLGGWTLTACLFLGMAVSRIKV